MRENKLPDVILRAMEPEDLDMMYAIENDHDTWSVTDVNTPYSRFVLHEFIANATGDIYTDKQVRLIVTNKSGEFIGMIDLFNFNPQHKRAEIGIIIRKKNTANKAMGRQRCWNSSIMPEESYTFINYMYI